MKTSLIILIFFFGAVGCTAIDKPIRFSSPTSSVDIEGAEVDITEETVKQWKWGPFYGVTTFTSESHRQRYERDEVRVERKTTQLKFR